MYFLVFEGGECNRESLEHIVYSEHLSLQVRSILIGDVTGAHSLTEEDCKPIAKEIGTLFVTKS